MTPLCKCAHSRDLHPGDGECIRPCGCQEFRLDPRSLIAAWNSAGPDVTLGALRDLELADESAATGDEAA